MASFEASTISETLGTYGHLFPYGGEKLAQAMEKRRQKYRKANGHR